MSEERRVARWFLFATLVLPLVQVLFAEGGIGVLLRAMALGRVAVLISYPWSLAAGVLLTFGLLALAVGLWKAPVQLWYVALAMGVFIVIATGFAFAQMVQGGGVTAAQAVRSVTARSVLSLAAYVLSAVLGCWLGAVWARRRSSSVAPGGAVERP